MYTDVSAGRKPSTWNSAVTLSTETSDQQKLMLSLATGSQTAFSMIYDHLSAPTFAICTHHLSSTAAADEAMHALWLYIWQNAPMLSEQGGSPWSIILRTAEQHAELHAQSERSTRATAVSLRH